MARSSQTFEVSIRCSRPVVEGGGATRNQPNERVVRLELHLAMLAGCLLVTPSIERSSCSGRSSQRLNEVLTEIAIDALQDYLKVQQLMGCSTPHAGAHTRCPERCRTELDRAR